MLFSLVDFHCCNQVWDGWGCSPRYWVLVLCVWRRNGFSNWSCGGMWFASSVFLNRHHSLLTHFCVLFNPLVPEPALTSHAKTSPQMPVLAVTGCKKACDDNCLSYPPGRLFGFPILLLLRTNKPMRRDFLSSYF